MIKRRIVWIVVILVLVTYFMPLGSCNALAAASAEDSAMKLHTLGLFRGVGENTDGTPNFALDRAPTRNEAVTMLVRLLGKEAQAYTGGWDTPFADVVWWARPYVGYAFANRLTTGINATSFGGDRPVTATQYLTFVLRALGYSSGVDFQWDRAWELSDELGITSGEYRASVAGFTRGDIATISFNALSASIKGSGKTLYEALMHEGVITLADAERVGLAPARRTAPETAASGAVGGTPAPDATVAGAVGNTPAAPDAAVTWDVSGAPAAPDATVTGIVVKSLVDGRYSYTIPSEAPKYDYYSKAFSTTTEFREIFLRQYGRDKAIIYDMIAGVMLDIIYDDTVVFDREITLLGFDRIASPSEFMAALLAVQKDMPFLNHFTLMGFTLYRSVDFNIFIYRQTPIFDRRDGGPHDNATYIKARQAVILELNGYRDAVRGISCDVQRLEVAARRYLESSVYDNNPTTAPYNGISALLTRRGICGSANLGFAMVGNAVGVPTFWLSIRYANHAATAVKPDGGNLKVLDATFGQSFARVTDVSVWHYNSQMVWDTTALGFLNEHYFPDVDVIRQLGGLS
jgi:hypothetical protein